MNLDLFIKELSKIGIMASNEQLEKLSKYYNFLKEYNIHTNLTTITNKEDVYLKHFYDSLTICKYIKLNNEKVIDIGSGAGFPGIVLKIFYPNINITVLDSNNKKTKFLSELCTILGIEVNIVNKRAEDYAINHLNEFDYCFSRAVAYIDIISTLSLPFIKNEGKVVLMKGNFTNELSTLEKHYKELNIASWKIENFFLPISKDERNIILINKKNPTTEVLNYSKIVQRNKKWKIV